MSLIIFFVSNIAMIFLREDCSFRNLRMLTPLSLVEYVLINFCNHCFKRFVAIDGTSLTVCEVDTRLEESWFTFMLVEYTQKKIIIPGKDKGGLLNIEVDVLGKYSESALAAIMPRIQELENKVKNLEEKLAQAEAK